jgi:ABC-2 type transport system permease protein
MNWAKQWLHYIKIRFMEHLQYPGNSLFFLIGFFLTQFQGPIFVLALYNAGATIQGWTKWEIVLLQGLFSIIGGIAFTYFWGLTYKTSTYVRDGRLELFRARPISTLRLVMMHSFHVQDYSQILAGIVITLTAASHLPITIAGIIKASLYAIPGILFLLGLTILAAALQVHFTNVPRMGEILGSLLDYTKFPKRAFGVAQASLVSLSPLFLINYYPTKALLNEPITLTGFTYSLLTGTVILIAGIIYWNYALTTYQGAQG